ncbi:DUF2312 domain-containing protein [Rhizobium beringeri]|uniref:DUF2312 domain-containing protein n=1 Tax=Rhizobium leguminosarum TaxID=384 RepID=UPI002DD44E2B|nr:DUF2312 domain-containing protein [Rhizobium leguminosarum]
MLDEYNGQYGYCPRGQSDDIKDVYGEAKGMGFDTKILKKVVALRKKDEQERMEEEAILDTYLHALGMIEAPPEG